ncbi:hypothetical protein P5G50_03820 [Leifsonia sp. F6_8S_P_1B]|uniref:Integral membrane protein n=1 Tax=Leifsonia williamsii TaxID=3035919 RepID=A0ABT8K9A8_9MICO|nr:hypothetical protein [Leifsonia williamsii]MDN4613573.1 hypothetical protein [Leifsonia williamsii]
MGTRAARVTRGMLASAVAVFVAALFHVAGGGSAPGPVALALSLAFATLASIALTARRLSLWRLSASVAVSQLLFHLLFGLGEGTATFVPAGAGHLGAGHLHVGDHLTMLTGMAPGAPAAVAGPAAMWLSHVSAALLTIVALRHGERAFWGLFDTARLAVSRFVERIAVILAPFVPGTAALVPADGPRLPLALGLPLVRLRHRGPPAVFGAL